ncbi:transglutaminase domain-containing protein [Apibacter sp. HY039]|uniref:DUF3857 domain-containing protein n=1 Tax=Apibacter sp. HY039 TaxID=2501476 RepID=UPI000FEBE26C|nr:transglutaminase domain-containing protein [Apibacter sp. HY039]
MKNTLTILFIACLTSLMYSQKYTFGKISIQDIEEQESKIETEAPAEIIYRDVYIEVDISGKMEIQVTERLKIYNKDLAENYLTYQIPLHKQVNKQEDISGFKASTYNLIDGKIVETKIKSSQTFTEEKHKYLNFYKFTFPDVRNGSILEYKYTLHSPFIFEIPEQYFNYKIPLREINYQVRIPQAFYYVPDLRGENIHKLDIKTESQQSPNGYPISIYNLNLKEVKSYQEEPFVLNYNNIRTSVRYELVKIQYEGKTPKSFATTWEEIAKTLLKNDNFNFYISTRHFQNILLTILEGKQTNEEKAKAILTYIQENYVWNEYNSIMSNQNINKTVKEKTGNSADLNLLLVAMLREAGIDANPVVLSTVSNGMLNYSFPSLQKLNYVIAGYYDNQQLQLLDATSKYSSLNLIPKRALNHRGIYIKKDNVHIVNLSNKIKSTSAYMLKYEIKDDFEFAGTLAKRNTHYLSMTDNEAYNNNQSEFQSNLKKNYNLSMDKLEIASGKNSFRYSFNFSSVSGAERIGEKIIFNPLIFLQDKEQIFKSETRSYPIELGSAFKQTKNVTITLPKGYKVDALPKSHKYILEENLGSYTYIIKDLGNQIELKTELEINQYFLSADYYSILKEFWQHMINTNSQYISIIKE